MIANVERILSEFRDRGKMKDERLFRSRAQAAISKAVFLF